MRDYGKVYSTFWSSDTTGTLSQDGKLLALYLMTCSHSTIAGVFRLPDGYVSEDLGWSVERVAKGFVELLSNGFANRCETTKWVWVVKHLEWNKPENPNQCKSAAKIALSIPDACAWKLDYMRSSAEVLALPLPQTANPSGTVSKGLLNQKQEQKQEQNSSSLRSEEGAKKSRRPPRSKKEETTLAAYLEACKAEQRKPLPPDHPIREWCAGAGIAEEMLQVAWVVFRRQYTEDPKYLAKKQKDWPAHFANAVRKRWGGLWYAEDGTGEVKWTTIGLTEKAALEAKARAREASHPQERQHEHA